MNIFFIISLIISIITIITNMILHDCQIENEILNQEIQEYIEHKKEENKIKEIEDNDNKLDIENNFLNTCKYIIIAMIPIINILLLYTNIYYIIYFSKNKNKEG